jgi:hypothetical protein
LKGYWNGTNKGSESNTTQNPAKNTPNQPHSLLAYKRPTPAGDSQQMTGYRKRQAANSKREHQIANEAKTPKRKTMSSEQ